MYNASARNLIKFIEENNLIIYFSPNNFLLRSFIQIE